MPSGETWASVTLKVADNITERRTHTSLSVKLDNELTLDRSLLSEARRFLRRRRVRSLR